MDRVAIETLLRDLGQRMEHQGASMDIELYGSAVLVLGYPCWPQPGTSMRAGRSTMTRSSGPSSTPYPKTITQDKDGSTTTSPTSPPKKANGPQNFGTVG